MNRTAYIAALCLLASATSFAGKPLPPGPAPLGPLVVVDANGAVVGRLGGTSAGQYEGNAYSFMTVGGLLVSVPLGATGYPGGGGPDITKLVFMSYGAYIHFEAQDCSGAACMYYRQGDKVTFGVTPSRLVRLNEGDSALLYVAAGDRVTRTLASRWFGASCEVITPFTALVYPLSAPVDLKLQFLEPFTIK